MIGASFIENQVGVTVILNGERDHAVLTDYFTAEIKVEHMDNIWFQQNGIN